MSHVPSRPGEGRPGDALRKHLALDRLSPELGVTLVSVSPDAQRHVLRRLDQVLTDPPSPHTLELGRHAACSAVHEFALLAAGRPPLDPSAAVLMSRFVRAEAAARSGTATTETLLATIAAAIRHQVARHPRLVTHKGALHASLGRYLDHLRSPILLGSVARHRDSAPERPDDVAPFLYHHLRQQFGSGVRHCCVTVQVPAEMPAGAATAAAATGDAVDGVCLAASDHLVLLHPSAFPPAEQGSITVYAGPVPLHELVRAYQSAALLARMVKLGWAKPARAVHWHLQSSASMTSDLPLELLEQLAPHLEPLLRAALPHRVELVRTLHRVLVQPTTTLKQHAKALNISPSTLRHHLAPLEPVLKNDELPPAQLIALASVLPALDFLWRVELSQLGQPKRATDTTELAACTDAGPVIPPHPREGS